MSAPHTSQAVVLRTIEYSATSLIVRLFTETYGKVTVMARGARRPKHALHGVLSVPHRMAVDYRHRDGRDIQTLVGVELADSYAALAGDLARSAAAWLLVEMLDRAVQVADPLPLLFRLITASLEQLNTTSGDFTTVVHFYQLHLARQLGYAPQLEKCPRCGRQVQTAVLDPLDGDLLCVRCRPSGSLRLGRAALSYLRDLAATHISELDSLRPASGVRQEVDQFLLKYLFIHVDGMDKLRSLKFWRQVRK